MLNKDALIDYLLHRMPESERLDFAERWFTDSELCQQLENAEAELLDAYVGDRLPRGQRAQVERYLLHSDVQRRKLTFAAALHGVVPAPRRPRFSWIAAGAAAMLVILAGVAGWMALQNIRLRTEIARLERPAGPAAGKVVGATLTSSLRGSASGSAVSLPTSADMLRLDLELPGGSPRQAYAASLSASGRIVWKEEPLRAEAGGAASFVRVWIPAAALETGSYVVALEAEGNPDRIYEL